MILRPLHRGFPALVVRPDELLERVLAGLRARAEVTVLSEETFESVEMPFVVCEPVPVDEFVGGETVMDGHGCPPGVISRLNYCNAVVSLPQARSNGL